MIRMIGWKKDIYIWKENACNLEFPSRNTYIYLHFFYIGYFSLELYKKKIILESNSPFFVLYFLPRFHSRFLSCPASSAVPYLPFLPSSTSLQLPSLPLAFPRPLSPPLAPSRLTSFPSLPLAFPHSLSLPLTLSRLPLLPLASPHALPPPLTPF